MNAGDRSEQTLAAARAHHRGGRLVDAEGLYRLVCNADPKNARALQLFWAAAYQLRHPDAAVLVGGAESHNDRGVILEANGLFADALCFERAMELNPGYSEVRNNLGRTLRSRKIFVL
jgi:protein O-GlcNAc transferase